MCANSTLQNYLKRYNFFKFGIVICLVVMVCVLNFYQTGIDWRVRVQTLQLDVQRIYTGKHTGNSESEPRKLLYWMPFNNLNQVKIENKCMETCPVKCIITDDKSDIENVDLVNFHLTDLWTENWAIDTKAVIDFPSYRRSDQIWMLTNLEPPPNLFGDLRVLNGVFNWTIWYRKDATVHLPYGLQRKLNEAEAAEARKRLESRNFYREKTGEITGVISNCKDTSRRYRFVKELAKHLDVDMFGHCYNKICGDPLKHASCDNVTRTYKFYMALENSKCKDYITEKYWWSLNREHIPIVNWDLSHVDETIPIPGSYISVADFDGMESLVRYIRKVSANETLYNSYFDWKKQYSFEHSCTSCMACKALQERRMPQVVKNLDRWVRNDVCDKVQVSDVYLHDHLSIYDPALAYGLYI